MCSDSLHPIPPSPNPYISALNDYRGRSIHQFGMGCRIPGHRGLALLPRMVKSLTEVALPVRQRHPNHRDMKIRRGAECVSCQYAEASAIGWDIRLKSDFHRKIGHSTTRSIRVRYGHDDPFQSDSCNHGTVWGQPFPR